MTTGTEDYYQARAREYDLVYDKPERQDDLRSLRIWLARSVAGRRVLEVAAGTGYWTDAYADTAACVTATDVSEATLAVARARRVWPATVTFAEADALHLAGASGQFDTVFAGFFWSHVPLEHMGRFLATVSDRLEGTGTVIFMDNRYVASSSHPISRVDRNGNTYQQRKLSDGSRWEVLKNFPSAAELRSCLVPLTRTVEIIELDYYWTAVCRLGQDS